MSLTIYELVKDVSGDVWDFLVSRGFWMDGWMDGWMNGWMDGWMDRWEGYPSPRHGEK